MYILLRRVGAFVHAEKSSLDPQSIESLTLLSAMIAGQESGRQAADYFLVSAFPIHSNCSSSSFGPSPGCNSKRSVTRRIATRMTVFRLFLQMRKVLFQPGHFAFCDLKILRNRRFQFCRFCPLMILGKGRTKIHKVMKEKKEGTLRSGSGKKVKTRKQAVAIALSETRKSGAKVPTKKKNKS